VPQGDIGPQPPADPVIATAWSRDGITIATLRGSFPPEPWTAPLLTTTWGVTLADRGAYRRRADGLEQIVDATTGFLRRPGQEVSTSTFTRMPEDVSALTLDAPFLHQLPDLSASAGPITVEPSVALAHRLLRRRLQGPPDNLGVQCAVVELVQRCLPPVRPLRPGTARPSTTAARLRLVSDTVEILNVTVGEDLGLIDIARLVGTSPAHLSRLFGEVTGVTMSRYRTWLRVHAVLDRLEAGDSNLADVAAATGFADHGHMTRTVTGHLGATPSALRALLVGDQHARPVCPSV
jgi:AraC-like DNA-binding protein